ncbi:FAD-dependent pyridine nucleotide-disulphide oxidoreductase [Leptothrix cholodnii SP-6]|uniref:FAD-dependent pyridine nucleotide-disulphide oxidoreductase n=1 Tax=Leptothrix cholodnii (strain ATCC 51168 / LMG 8142 / SP-6) TaxID=395495 RepID=B1Y2Q4_LEPCP|nr:FAD-dependent oxidoreductase [Leptothrix cholodnii]ACB34396.1 FAD-dependent pyridine nucleotide-disulphide oxidoreductase [Leptothrix cholodnii SP-6]
MSNPTGAGAAAWQPFPNFMQMNSYLPGWAWRLLRLCSVLGALAVAGLLALRPEQGLPLFWGLIVPVLPLVFMLTPGIWRNVCPLASSNQAPRRLGLIKKINQKTLATGAAFPIGIGLFIAAILARKLMFNTSGVATAALIVGAMVMAFAGGIVFKGKSGWCSSICPLLPVQRLYGQTPFLKIANTQCEPCVGCAKNCYDFNPGSAYLADQYDADPSYRDFRRFFAGLFPGLILGFYLVPGTAQIGAGAVVLQMLLYMASSLTVFTLLDLLLKSTRNRLPVVFAALAINVYYWFAAPIVLNTLQQLGAPIDLTLVGAVRAAVVIASLVWIARSIQAERLFLNEQVRRGQGGEIHLAPVVVETVRLHRNIVPRRVDVEPVASDAPAANSARIQGGDTQPGALAPLEAAPADAVARPPAAAAPKAGSRPELRIEPEGRCVPLKKGASLLDTLEGCGAAIQAGCRAGACGGDPIAITGGADCLGPIGDTERATLARLGHASNTRMACMARVRNAGTVTVELKPHAVDAPGAAPAPTRHAAPAAVSVVASVVAPVVARHDRSIRSVVIVGNGVAGLTAAEHVRRHHPDCEIHLIARERYLPYNRMAVSALINQRSGMQGMGLKPDAWYAEQRITHWLNTRATDVDTTGRQVQLATGETLGYDRLILANGSQAWMPPVEGFGIAGSFLLRQANDAMAIRAFVQRHGARHAVVVGAGLLGLEAAASLRQLGLGVQVLSLNEQVLDRQIDRAASELVVAHLSGQGIELVGNAKLRRVVRSAGRISAIRLEDGRELPTELLVVCAGTRAELTLAHAAGLATGRGITVDAQMRTSAEHVYAAGDVAEFEGEQFGLWAIAVAQGEVAARSALGLAARFESIQPVTALKLRGIEVRSAGAAGAGGAGQSELLCAGSLAGDEPDEADAGPGYCKLVVEEHAGGDRLIGVVIVGAHEIGDELLDAVKRRASLASLQSLLAGHRWLLQPAEVAQARVAPTRGAPTAVRRVG